MTDGWPKKMYGVDVVECKQNSGMEQSSDLVWVNILKTLPGRREKQDSASTAEDFCLLFH